MKADLSLEVPLKFHFSNVCNDDGCESSASGFFGFDMQVQGY